MPRLLPQSVLTELLPPLLAGTLLFAGILSFGYFFVSSQWLQGVPPGLIAQWIGYQLPDTLVKVLPMAAVLMTVVAFGRMNTERELVAMQAGGVSLGRAAWPVAAVGALLAALSLWLSLWVAPRANVETRSLYWDVLTGAGLGNLAGKTMDLRGGLSLYLSSYDTQSSELRGVRVEKWNPQQPRQGQVIFAESGTFSGNQLQLRDYQVFSVDYAQAARLSALPEGDPQAFREAVQATFPAVMIPESPQAVLTLDTGLSRKETFAQYADAVGADALGWDELQAQIRDPGRTPEQRRAAQLTLHRKLALPLSNLVLALAALPFALRFGRSLGVSLGIALAVALGYYFLFLRRWRWRRL
ncbi:LptF/LptG family permease [Deinococcus lacus]|uniref:LptF/LptG family permease n=1 Tax=Deinococcus lacus TaxID=392561 RepID=A0ABW1YBE5_9DEIO